MEIALNRFFFDTQRRLRNGWWMLTFVALIAVTRLVYRPLKGVLLSLGAAAPWLEMVPFLLVLVATWACTSLRREPLGSVGLRIDRPWLRQVGAGTLLGLASLGLAVALIWLVGGVHFELDPRRSVAGLALGLYVFLCGALFEELLFRGFLFQRLAAGVGVWTAQILFAVLFSLGHWGNPGMDGTTKLWASLELGLAALLLGLAYLRTGSLALPIGLHLGWNWAQGTLLGHGVSGFDQHGWFRPVFHGQQEWISGGNFGPEASVFGVVADLVLIVALWRWKGSVAATANSEHPAPPPRLRPGVRFSHCEPPTEPELRRSRNARGAGRTQPVGAQHRTHAGGC